jgi:hypothetical protein
MRSFIIFTRHKILLGYLNEGKKGVGYVAEMGREEKCIQGLK